MGTRQRSQPPANRSGGKWPYNRDMQMGRWIDLANLLDDFQPEPENAPAAFLQDLWRRWRGWLVPFDLPADIDPADKDMLRALWRQSALSREKRWFLLRGWEGGHSEAMQLKAYRLILWVRQALDAIVREFELLSRLKETDEDFDREFQVELPAPQVGPVISLKARRTDNVIDFGPYSEFYEALEVADLSRIRRCRKCHRLFYAARTNKFACSLKCQEAYRQQYYRAHRKRYDENSQRNKKAKAERKRLKSGRQSHDVISTALEAPGVRRKGKPGE